MKTKAYKNGAATGKKFDGSKNWDYTPGGPYRDPKDKDVIANWWKGFNSTCNKKLAKNDG